MTNKDTKDRGISLKVDSATVADLKKFEDETGVDRSTLIRAALHATLTHYRKRGFIQFPLMIVNSEPTHYPEQEPAAILMREPS